VAKRGKKVVVGSDSLTTVENIKLTNVQNDPKIFNFKHFTILVAGEGPLTDILEEMVVKEYEESEYNWNWHEIHNRQDCIFFLTSFKEFLEDKDESNKNSGLAFEFLIATKEKIFWIMQDSSVFEIKDFWAIGSGSELALGTLHVLFPLVGKEVDGAGLTLEKAVYKAIEAAVTFDKDCGLPIEVKRI
jgi:ATP-dependent protease HslVU (ClpYQ) peptidase subunit